MPTLDRALAALEAIAPLALAAPWDNVGLLVEGTRPIRRALCTIDLTEGVLAEALAADADLVVSYHPPIFGGLKRLTRAVPGTRTVLDLVRAGVHVYSPHTALDAVPGGLADWLLEAFGPLADARPIEPAATDPSAGAGRIARLAAPRPLAALLPEVKRHLDLPAVRLAAPPERVEVRSVAVCPGAGGGVFERLGPVDLLLTGEMRHHDVLARVAGGAAVVLTEHTNSERGYLPRFAARLARELAIPVEVARTDRDPLRLA